MATLALSMGGSALGGTLMSGTFMGVTGAQWGFMIGSLIASQLFGPKDQKNYGPRLNDATYSGNVEGTDMPILWGSGRITGKPIWIKTPPTEVATEESQGGKGGPEVTNTTYSYYQDFVLCFGEFICSAPRRAWANQELIYDASGHNTEVSDTSFSFSWYTGDQNRISSLIEQDVGVGNCPAYNGRVLMQINSLELTSRYGNRIPVIEVELHTTGSNGTSVSDHPMGLPDSPATQWSQFYQIIRHPIDNTFIAVVGTNHLQVPARLFFGDMAGQYVREFFQATYSPQSIRWFSDPYSYNPYDVSYLIHSRVCPSCSDVYLSKIKYPAGTLEQFVWAGSLGGGAILGPESQWYYPAFQSTFGTSFGFVDKTTLKLGTIYSVTTVIGETGWTASNFAHVIECTNWAENEWHTFIEDASNLTYLVKITYDAIAGPTITKISRPFQQVYPSNETDLTLSSYETNNNFVYIAETDELWFGYKNKINVTTAEFRYGIMAINISSGNVSYYRDFFVEGDTTTSSYWPAASGAPHLHYERVQRRIWLEFSGTGDVFSIQVDSRSLDSYPGLSAGNAWAVSYPNRATIWGAYTSGGSLYFRERKLRIANTGQIAISEPIADICEMVGLDSTDYDVSNLTSTFIGGFIHGTRHSARSDIETLLAVAPADAIQSDYKLKFVLRGGASTLTVPLDDLGAQELNGDQTGVDPIVLVDPMSLELPRVLELEYNSSDNVYLQGLAQSYIATGDSNEKSSMQLPMVLSDQRAFDLAEQYHQQMANPQTFAFELTLKYSYLEPTDIIEVPKNEKNYRVRLNKVARGVNWILKCEAIADLDANYTTTAVAPGIDAFLGTINTEQNPTALILDGPLLRDIDADQPGPYLTSFVYNQTFPVTLWYYSVDNAIYNNFATQTVQPAFGQANTILNAFVWEDWDDISYLDITVYNNASLSSSTKSAILADPTINAFAYGIPGRWEYFNAATVTLLSTSPNLKYRLSSLLRGRRGTNNNISIHATKDFIISLSNGINRHVLQNTQIGGLFYYKSIRSGEILANHSPVSATIDGQPLMPYSPIDVLGVLNTGNVDVTWTRRSRKGGSLGGTNTLTDGVGGPINEEVEKYEVDYTQVTTGVPIRTETDILTTSTTYSSTDQTSDGADILGRWYIDVYQISAVVGRGYRGRYLYDKGWAQVVSIASELGATVIMPLDDASGSTAREVISGTTPGTYTSASVSTAVSADNFAGLECDTTGYMQAGVTLRDGLIGANGATVIIFGSGATQAGSYFTSITQGGANSSLLLTWSAANTVRSIWAPKTGTAGLTTTWSSSVEAFAGIFWTVAATCNLNNVFDMYGYVNGLQRGSQINSTLNSNYATTFQTQTRNTSYNDTINGSTTATSRRTTGGGLGFALVFDQVLSVTNINKIYTAARATFNNLITQHPLLNTFTPFDHASATTTMSAIKGTSFTAVNTIATQRSVCTGAVWSTWLTSATTSYLYADLPESWKIQTFSIGIFFYPTNTITAGGHFIYSLAPRDYANATDKKGIHLKADSTNGLTLNVGEGAAAWTALTASTPNITANNYYCVIATFHATNGINLYLNGTAIANNGGSPISINWTDGTVGWRPTPATAFINNYSVGNAADRTVNGTGITGYYNDFFFIEDELSAAEVAAIAKRGLGIVV